MKNLLTFIALLFFSLNAFAIRESRPTPIDSRIRVMVYNPNDVFKFTGYYGYQASIELGNGEEVVSISMGDTTSWQIVPAGSRIFIKPMEPDATTNMTLITNKRTYFFELYAQETTDIRDPEMVFNVKFLYPDEEEEDHVRTLPPLASLNLISATRKNLIFITRLAVMKKLPQLRFSMMASLLTYNSGTRIWKSPPFLR